MNWFYSLFSPLFDKRVDLNTSEIPKDNGLDVKIYHSQKGSVIVYSSVEVSDFEENKKYTINDDVVYYGNDPVRKITIFDDDYRRIGIIKYTPTSYVWNIIRPNIDYRSLASDKINWTEKINNTLKDYYANHKKYSIMDTNLFREFIFHYQPDSVSYITCIYDANPRNNLPCKEILLTDIMLVYHLLKQD